MARHVEAYLTPNVIEIPYDAKKNVQWKETALL